MTDTSPGSPAPVRVTIDGREVEVPAGTLLIQAAQQHGTYIPRFCWHERMKPVGMCRMCLVEVEGVRGLPAACTLPVADGMVVRTTTPAVQKVQDGVLEFLLVNHPLDCPVCDRGGECPLQDQTLAFGPGESRFVEEKRHFEKPIPLSDLVLLDRERCIQCARCTRFADEVAGDPLITFVERGDRTEVLTFPDEPFSSYFSGNTVQICPVGALTSKPYRFRARPWDLTSVETSCTTCAVGCRGTLQSSSNRLVRLLGVDSEPVNQGWLCDKGRYGLDWVHSEARLREPLVRTGDELRPASWPEALDAAAGGLRRALDLHGPQALAVIGGARGTNEDAYAWARFAKGVLATDNVDAQLGDGLPAEVVLGLPRASIADCDAAAAVVLVAPDLKEELPVLYLRLRRAAVDLGVPLVEIGSRDTGLTPYASAVLRHAPGDAHAVAAKLAAAIGGARTGDAAVDAAAALVEGRDGDVVVVLGRPSLAESAEATVRAAAALAGAPRVRFLSALRRANVHGALDMGLAPGLLPGRVTLEAGREWFRHAWGRVPDGPGLDAHGILRAAAEGRLHALVLLGADPLADFPDRALARDALDAVGFLVGVDAFLHPSLRRADVVLPVAVFGEQAGSATNLEGRVQRLARLVSAPGTAMEDWRVAVELAARLDADLDLEVLTEVQDEVARVAPAYAGIDAALLRRARDGARAPLARHGDELVLGPPRLRVTEASWEPIPAGTHAAPPDDGVPEAVARPTGAAAGEGAAPAGGDGGGEGGGDGGAGAAAGDAAPAVPGLVAWRGEATPATPAPARDAYALRLVTGRTLYDAGRLVAETPSLAGLAPGAHVALNPAERDRLVGAGTTVRVTSAATTVVLPVRSDPAVPPGVAFVPHHQPGRGDEPPPAAADLVDAAAPVTDVRIETQP